MAIKDIFKMIKADRYTQDGREELIKAQEAVTEDVRYKPGDISKATGLQKQPDGSWKPVKNAPAQSKKQAAGTGFKPGALEEMAKEVDSPEARQNYDDFMKAYKERERREISGDPTPSASGSGVPTQGSDWMSLPSGTRMTFEGAKEKMAKNNERIETIKKMMEGKSKADNFRLGSELKRLQNENDYISERLPPEQSASGSAPSAPKFETEQENAKYEEGLKGWDNVNPDRLPDIKKKVEQKIDYYKKYDPYAMLGKKTGLTAAQKSAVQQNMAQAKENLAFYTGQLEGINKKMGGGSNDSAPRILTGDCKIRIKKSK